MKLIVGLGNPGKEYIKTRHNVGYIILDGYLGDVKWKKKFNAYYYLYGDICFVKPLTYMNNSGYSVRKFVDYFKIAIQDIMVIQDDLDMQIGTYKMKINSSDGGHNGIKSIINSLNTNEFARLKIGIRKENVREAKDFVLDNFSSKDMKLITDNPQYKKIINSFINEGLDKTLNTYRS